MNNDIKKMSALTAIFGIATMLLLIILMIGYILSYNDDDFVRELYKNFNIQAVSRQNNLSSGTFKEVIIKNY